ncbi:thiamine diphosphokinase [Pullulanibacillus sp. KACC 23026]|uniref:thiamine diphosphokinase n=1 Tax=Pullulanibacillus sp. KACC 23026 TaxID=3028315 RepID=UPI0023B0F384|nr:thiamine diphosphokinase [Pullulanibacillus sp. KACC 23026]WEG11624.1 thiamine diphosphokinase [Pullulanibacillus sp. KACC 23026]
MNIAILSGGPDAYLPAFSNPLLKDCLWVGVDRGTVTLLNNGLIPIRAFGDFDSITATDLSRIHEAAIPLSTYKKEKDATDMELALDWVLKQSPETCFLVGATGGRLDHALMNQQLLIKAIDTSTSLFLLDHQNIVTLLKPGSYTIEKRPEYNYVSFIAYSPAVHGLTLSGFQYDLADHLLKWGSSLCISNHFIGSKGTVRFTEGLLLLVQSRD